MNQNLSPSLADPARVKRNFSLGVWNGILFIFADSLMDPTLVLVAFLSHLTQSPILLGLLIPIQSAAWTLPQLWMSGYMQSRPLKIDVYRKMSALRIAAWILQAFIITFVRNPAIALPAFFVVFTISSIASGLPGLSFLEVIGKTVPPERRGELFAWRLGVGGLLGVGGSFIVRWLIGPQSPLIFPVNFGVLSFAFLILAGTSLLIYNAVDEVPDEKVLPVQGVVVQFRRGLAFFRQNRNYHRLLLTQSLFQISGSAAPFFAVYVRNQFGAGTEWVGTYLGVNMITNLLANVSFGYLSRRINNQRVLLIATTTGSLMSFLALLLPLLAGPLKLNMLTASLWLIPVFALGSIRSTGIGVSSNSLLLNIAPESDRSVVIGFTQTIIGLVMLSTGVNGFIMNWLGFPTLVGITLAAHLLALYLVSGIRDSR